MDLDKWHSAGAEAKVAASVRGNTEKGRVRQGAGSCLCWPKRLGLLPWSWTSFCYSKSQVIRHVRMSCGTFWNNGFVVAPWQMTCISRNLSKLYLPAHPPKFYWVLSAGFQAECGVGCWRQILKVILAQFLSPRNSLPHSEMNEDETVTHSRYSVVAQESTKGKGWIIFASQLCDLR